jgi:hypothetical protein
LSSPERSAIRLVFAARGYSETTIGDLRRLYGPEFAKGCEGNEKIVDVVQRRPSLTRVILRRELKRFEQI